MNEFKEKLTELLSQIKEKAHTVTETIKEKTGDGADWVKTHKKIALPVAAILLCLCLAGGGVLVAGSVMDNQPSGKITAEKEKDADTEETLSADVSEEDTLDGTDEDGDITEDPASEEAGTDADADTAGDDAAAVSKSDQSSDQKASDQTSKNSAKNTSDSKTSASGGSSSKPSGSKGSASSSKPSGSASVSKPSSSGSTSSSKPSNNGSASKPSSGSTSAPSTPSKPAHTHSYVSTVTTQPTCCNPGVRTYTCSCGNSYTESIPATGNHNWVAQTWQKPVYETHVICNGCGKDFGGGKGADDAAVEHVATSDFYGPCQSYSSKPVVVGYTTETYGYKCSTCGATKGL
mgnify:CR=1 FL=1